ncbi:MAG: peptide transporter, partial [Chitinophagales bacterium]|nr:peptide transporter [Chitinophagales bacterium]
QKKKNIVLSAEEEDLGKGNLFATGLVAGGALAGVLVAILSSIESVNKKLGSINAEHSMADTLGHEGYKWLGVGFFALMAWVLYRIATSKKSA